MLAYYLPFKYDIYIYINYVHLCSIYQIWQLFDHDLDDKIILASFSRPGWRQAVERDIVEAKSTRVVRVGFCYR